MAKMGRPAVDNPKNTRITIRFDAEEYKQMKACAEHRNQTIAQFIRSTVKDVVSKES